MAKTQEPKLEDLPYFQAYFSGNIPRKYGQTYGTNVPPFSHPEIPIDHSG